MKNLYLILLIVVIVGIVAIFALTFLIPGNQNLTGASIWGSNCNCNSAEEPAVCISCCKDYATESSTNNCETSPYRCQQCGGN